MIPSKPRSSPKRITGIPAFCLLLSGFFLFTLGACGYRFSGSGEIPAAFDKLFIRVIVNRTTETGLDVLLTDDLKNEFIYQYGGTLSEIEGATAELSGNITGIRTWTVSRSGALTSLERRVSIAVDVDLKDVTGETIRSARDVSADETYGVVAGDKQATEQNRQTAILSVSKQIAEAVFHRLTEDF
jgi:hypothetical protein